MSLGDGAWKVLGAPLRALMPKNPWLRVAIIALPVLVVLAFLDPVLSLLGRGLDLLFRTFEPLVDNPVGRLVLLNLLLVGAAMIAWYSLRGRWRALRSGMVLRNHLSGVNALIDTDPRRSRQLLERVARSRATPPSEFPAAREDAKIKLARLALEQGAHEESLAWLTRVREKKLPKELQRSLEQLRVEAGYAQGDVLPESLEKDVRAALERFPKDRRLLALLRRLLRDRGALEEVAEVQQRIAACAPPRSRAEESALLVDDLVAAGEGFLAAGEHRRAQKLARRARAVDDGVAAGCLMGKILRADGNLKAAVREWAGTRSAEGLDLIADLLDEHPGALSPRELLECCPTEGALLLVAREYARAGESEKALRAARRAAKNLGPQPSVTAALGEVLALCGCEDEAAQLREQALLRLTAPATG